MMFKAVNCIAYLLFFVIGSAFAQTNETDSLINLLNKTPEDTNKVNLYWKTGVSIVYHEPLQALPYFKQGTALALKLNFISGIEKCYNATSLAYSYNAEYDSAFVYINYAVYYGKKAGNKRRLALAFLNRADIYQNLHNYSAALKDCDTALNLAEQVGSNDAIGRIYSIMFDVYMGLKQYPQALATLDKSDMFFEKVNNRQMIAMNYSGRADIFLLTDEPAKAIPWLQKAIRIADSLHNYENLSAYHSELAEAYNRLKRYEEAKNEAEKSLKYALQTNNVGQQAVIYSTFFYIEAAQNNFPKATGYAQKAYNLITGRNDLRREMEFAANLADAYFKTGNAKQAYHYLQISSKLNDSLIKQNFTEETARLQNSFEVKQKDKEIELLNKNQELQQQKLFRQRLVLGSASLLLLLAFIATGLIMNRNKLKQRMKELELRNQIAADLHDEVGSSLSSIHMLSQMAAQRGDEATHRDILTRMSSNAKETMDKMGDIVWMIKPGETQEGNLKQRIERFAYEICSGKNITANLDIDDLEKIKLTMEQRKNIYLIFKEAINNAVKYSGTDKIEVTASLQNNKLILQVKDFGKGFNVSFVKKGNGIDNMHNRAVELKGALTTESNEKTGTAIQLTVPV